jgi:DNA repair protein RecO (recombination protein O)
MSDSFILQTYPFREADLVVSFFTRDQGKLRGVARRARRPKSSFGSGLERLSHATVSYYQKENRELVSLNSCELTQSQFALASNYESSVALDYLAEITEQLLPPNETNERHFRLLIAVLDSLHAGGSVWAAVTYFALWAVRLAGLLPELARQRRFARHHRRDACHAHPATNRAAVGQRNRGRCAARSESPDRRTSGAQAANDDDPGGPVTGLTFQETVLR